MSSKTRQTPAEGQVQPALILGLRCLAVTAFAISLYLGWTSLLGGSVAGCGPDSGCDKVLGSRWSKWFGVPVSLGALAVYAAIFAATFRLGRKVPAAAQRQAWQLLVPAAVLAGGAAVWFIALQAVVLRAFCPYCMIAHAAGLLTAALLLWRAPFRNPPDKPWQVEKTVFLPPALAKKLALCAGAGLAVMAAGQVLHRPKTFAVQVIPSIPVQTSAVTKPLPGTQVVATATTNLTAAATQAFPKPAPAPPPPPPPEMPPNQLVELPHVGRALRLHNGAFELPLNELPLMGPPTAPAVMLSIFDYSCHHCRIMHWQLLVAHRALSNQLAIVSLPNPLDPRCNHTVTRTHRDHTNACDYARLGLAVWRANRSKMEEFENWLFAPERPVLPAAAQEYAGRLVGSNELARAQQDPWIEKTLQVGINLYATNYYQYRRGSMPQLIVGNSIVEGTVALPDLYKLLSANLGVKTPTQ